MRHCGSRGSAEVAPFNPKTARTQRPGKTAQDRMPAAERPRVIAARILRDARAIDNEQEIAA